MKCSKAQKLISDHIDGLLDAGKAMRLEKHLDDCPGCSRFLSDMESIVNSAKTLDTPGPFNDLWPAIKREVQSGNRKARKGWKDFLPDFTLYSRGPVFALASILGFILLLPMLYLGLPHMRNAGDGPKAGTLSTFLTAEQHYQSAIEALDRALAARETKLNPELLAVFENNLAIIDDSIRICKDSIGKSPENRETGKLLLICYREKVELLSEMKEITM